MTALKRHKCTDGKSKKKDNLPKTRVSMKTYLFKIEIEPDEEGWWVFYPPWEEIGASTWGKTKEEAIENIHEVLSVIVEEFIQEGKPIPVCEGIIASEEALVPVNIL